MTETMMTLDAAVLAEGLLDGSLRDHPYRPVLEAVCAGACAMLSVFQAEPGEAPVPFTAPPARLGQKGLVVTIGDDLDESRGVVAFDPVSLFSVLSRANVIVVQVAAFQAPVMAKIAATGAMGMTAVVIETREKHEMEWLEFIKANSNCPVVLITTRPEDR